MMLELNPPFIIIGAPESGVSLCGKILRAFGASILTSQESELDTFHTETLLECGCDRKGLERTPTSEIVNAFWNQKKAASLFKIVESHKHWGFCDYRATLFLNQWLEIFPEARIILIVRHPHNVAQEVAMKNAGLLHSDILAVWYEYHRGLSNVIDSTRTRVFRYDRLLDEPTVMFEEFANCQSDDLLDLRPTSVCWEQVRDIVITEMHKQREISDTLTPLVGNMWQSLRQKCIEIAQ